MVLRHRQATATDLSFVRAATYEAYAPWEAILGGPPMPMHEDYAPRIARNEVWIVEQHGEAAGVMVIEPADGYLMIYSLAVCAAHQSQGVGRWMIEAVERMARDANIPELRLYTSDRMTRNLAIYRQAGFRETGRRPHPHGNGWILVDMSKSIVSSRAAM